MTRIEYINQYDDNPELQSKILECFDDGVDQGYVRGVTQTIRRTEKWMRELFTDKDELKIIMKDFKENVVRYK